MRVIRFDSKQYIPTSHEDPKNPGSLKKVLIKKDDIEEGRLQMINWSLLPAGKSFQPHYHEDMDEVFIMVKGTAKIKSGMNEEILKDGDTVIIPAGEIHMMTNIGNEKLQYIAMGVAHGVGGKTVVIQEP